MCYLFRQVTAPMIALLLLFAVSAVHAQLTPTIAQIECIGFDYPMTETVIVPINVNRLALPLRATLKDESGGIVTSSDLGDYPPIVQVFYYPGEDVPDDAIWTEEIVESIHEVAPDEGNEFVYMSTSLEWHFNLSARNYKARGTYRIYMAAQGEAYQIEPTCMAEFVRTK